jgi:hypothetical protein
MDKVVPCLIPYNSIIYLKFFEQDKASFDRIKSCLVSKFVLNQNRHCCSRALPSSLPSPVAPRGEVRRTFPPPLLCLTRRPTAARPHRSHGLLASGASLHRASCHARPGPHLLPPRGAPSWDPPSFPLSTFSSRPS